MNMLTKRQPNGLKWVVRLFFVSLVLPINVLAQGVPPAPGQPPLQLKPQVLQQIRAMQTEKASWTPTQRKISSKLLLASKRRRGQQLVAGLPTLRKTITVNQAGMVLVDIKATVTDALLARIVALGGKVVNSHSRYNAIRARIPLAQVQTLAAEAAVRSIRPADRAITHVTSQGDVAHKANLARHVFGVDGTGLKIGVLSDSVDALADLQAAGELPNDVTVLPGQSGNPGTSEGTAMLEIVHDLAPGAGLFFATAFNSQAAFAQNIRDLRFTFGCDVIVDDVFFFAEPAFQDGIIAQAVEDVVADGAVYFSSAGNAGNLNDGTSGVWEGDFSPIAAPPSVGGIANDFGGGANFNTITGGFPSFFILQWSDPIGGSDNDYDLFLLDPSLSTVIDGSTDSQDGNDDPIEGIFSIGPGDFGNALVVIKFQGAQSRYLRVDTIGGKLSIATAGQTSGHAAAAGAFGVAAVDASSAGGLHGEFDGSESVETFSSDGPRHIFYEADGTPITPGNFSSTGGVVRSKPDLAAADGISTATPGFSPFFGTSAAAPHAAAIAILLKSMNPTHTPAEIRTILTGNTQDIESTGFDRDSGFGILDALSALSATSGCPPPTAVCRDITRTLSANNTVTVSFNEIDNGSFSSGDCPIFKIEIKKTVGGDFGSEVTFGCGEEGPQDVTLRVTQVGGLTNACIAKVIIQDSDTDGDGTSNCLDLCPSDPNKIDPGQCGCGSPDIDIDGDGVADCVDDCPSDPNKVDPGLCGCGTPDTDIDVNQDCNGNGVPDGCDLASLASNDCNGNGIPDECEIDNQTDCNANGILDECDPDVPISLPGSPRTIAIGDSTVLGDDTPPATGGIPPYTFEWTLPGLPSDGTSTDPNPVFEPVNPGTFTARMVVTDSQGCQSVAFVTIKVTGDQSQIGGNPTTNTTSPPNPNQIGQGLCAPMSGMTLMAMWVGILTLRIRLTRRRR